MAKSPVQGGPTSPIRPAKVPPQSHGRNRATEKESGQSANVSGSAIKLGKTVPLISTQRSG